MEVRCEKCQARYKVADEKIGPQGLMMKCGKCGNTFRVSRDAGAAAPRTQLDQQPVAPAPRPATTAPAPRSPGSAPRPPAEGNATLAFAAPVVPKPGAARPPAPATKPAPGLKTPTPSPAPADEGAGRTMMFQTGSLPKTAAGSAKPAAPKPPPAQSESGATIVFGQSPAAPKPVMPSRLAKAEGPAETDNESAATMVFGQSPIAAAAKVSAQARPPAGAKPAASSDDTAGSTMMFGAAPVLPTVPFQAKVPKAAPRAPEPVAEPESDIAASTDSDGDAPPETVAEARTDESDRPEGARAANGAGESQNEAGPEHTSEVPSHEGGVQVDGIDAQGSGTTAAEGGEGGTFDKAPPKGLLIGIAAGLAVLLVLAGGLVAYKKLGRRPVPQGALDALVLAQAASDKDSLASIADAEAKAKDAIEQAGPKARFPQATAALAQIEVQWSDALTDQAALLQAKAQGESDETKKTAAEAKVNDLQAQAKARLKAAFDAVVPALKADARSPDLEIALAEYYRAQKSPNMAKELKKAQALKGDEARIALVQGEAFAREPDDAEKALPKLKDALAGAPRSARIHFRTAMANLALHNNDEALKELKETLRLSPQHERAKMAMEQLATAEGK